MDGSLAQAIGNTSCLPAGNSNALIVSTYVKGATRGQGLGTAGYSYELVRQLFLPLLRRWGEVIFVDDAKTEVERVGKQLRSRSLRPIHLGIIACQDMYLSPTMPNIVVPAWEFPDVPNFPFDGNPQNDWVATSNRCDMVLAHVPFTAKALINAGVTTPVREVPVPIPEAYFKVPLPRPVGTAVLPVPGIVFPGLEAHARPTLAPPERNASLRRALRTGIKRSLRAGKLAVKQVTPKVVWSSACVLREQWRRARAINMMVHPPTGPIRLSGVVYTSIFNPADGRKNWTDLISGFVWAMKDCADATLVVKLIKQDTEHLSDIIRFYRSIALPHRCRIAIIRDYLTDEQMMSLLAASSYYVTTTRAEGNCLPLMNYLAAGRPGISPAHSAIGDYFAEDVGFVVESHCEPSCWPQETEQKLRTTWARLVWPSLVEQLRQSYHVAKDERRTYERLASNARARMRDWLGEDNVYPLLKEALDQVAGMHAPSTGHAAAPRAA